MVKLLYIFLFLNNTIYTIVIVAQVDKQIKPSIANVTTVAAPTTEHKTMKTTQDTTTTNMLVKRKKKHCENKSIGDAVNAKPNQINALLEQNCVVRNPSTMIINKENNRNLKHISTKHNNNANPMGQQPTSVPKSELIATRKRKINDATSSPLTCNSIPTPTNHLTLQPQIQHTTSSDDNSSSNNNVLAILREKQRKQQQQDCATQATGASVINMVIDSMEEISDGKYCVLIELRHSFILQTTLHKLCKMRSLKLVLSSMTAIK
jgi:hypothetical protein